MVTLFAQVRTAFPNVRLCKHATMLLIVKVTCVFALSLVQQTKNRVISTLVHLDGIVELFVVMSGRFIHVARGMCKASQIMEEEAICLP